MPNGTRGEFGRVFANGYEITNDVEKIAYHHAYKPNKIQPQNIGMVQYTPGVFMPDGSLDGYTRRGIGLGTAHNLFSPAGIGSSNDPELIITELMGFNAAPVQGDIANLIDGSIMDYKPVKDVTMYQRYTMTHKARGLRMPPGVLIYDNATFKTATNIASTPYDDGAESNATSKGGVAVLQVYNATGVAATGNLSLSGQPSDGDTHTVNGTVYTYKTALTPTAGQVLIGATVAATIANLWAALTGGQGSGTTYAAGTTSFTQQLTSATVYIALPTASNVINFTYATTGTGGNSFTLAKVGVNLAVSAATLAGGIAGDSYNVVLASSATSGGSYTAFATWNGVGATNTAIRTEIAVGVVINEWWKMTATLATGAGTSQTMGICVCVGRYFQS